MFQFSKNRCKGLKVECYVSFWNQLVVCIFFIGKPNKSQRVHQSSCLFCVSLAGVIEMYFLFKHAIAVKSHNTSRKSSFSLLPLHTVLSIWHYHITLAGSSYTTESFPPAKVHADFSSQTVNFCAPRIPWALTKTWPNVFFSFFFVIFVSLYYTWEIWNIDLRPTIFGGKRRKTTRPSSEVRPRRGHIYNTWHS